jgi:hypothetical protein
VELDALVSVLLGIEAQELIALYRARYAVLNSYEGATWFDANGRKISREFHAQGVGQSKDAFAELVAYLEEGGSMPNGYRAPFYKADREGEYRQAHAVFSERLRQAGG